MVIRVLSGKPKQISDTYIDLSSLITVFRMMFFVTTRYAVTSSGVIVLSVFMLVRMSYSVLRSLKFP